MKREGIGQIKRHIVSKRQRRRKQRHREREIH
jgi:hypothetical protein